MAESENTPSEDTETKVIIRHVVTNEPEHKTGAWKIALADMMTAMMAFFLIMWLIASTDDQTLKGIADYFKPPKSVVPMQNGSDGIAGGKSVLSDTLSPKESNPSILNNQILNEQKTPDVSHSFIESKNNDFGDPILKNTFQMAAKNNLLYFTEQKKKMYALLAQNTTLGELKDKIRIIEKSDGLLIQLIDEKDFSMFELGTYNLLPKARLILDLVIKFIIDSKSEIIINGHTDSHLFYVDHALNNWTLSALRANATREYLILKEVDEDKILKLVAFADSELMVLNNPYHPSNRRIEILLKKPLL
jgi:chemotaxis protein MotB